MTSRWRTPLAPAAWRSASRASWRRRRRASTRRSRSTPADAGQFGHFKAAGAAGLDFTVVEKSAVIKFDKHVTSRVFSPDELESLDNYMMKCRKYGIVELLDNKLAGVHVSKAPVA